MGDLDQSIRRAPFAAGGSFVARKDFTIQGRAFATGEAFPWRRLAVSLRLLRQLWAQSYLDCDGEPVAASQDAAEPAAAEPAGDLFDDSETPKPAKRRKG